MNQAIIRDMPALYPELLDKSSEIGFQMPSDQYIGTLLKTLVASKPVGNFLELGTGIGLSLSWMLDGMDNASKLTSIDNDGSLIAIAKEFFATEERLRLECQDGTTWIKQNQHKKFDLIFADAWPGKYDLLDETLGMLKSGGFYVIDDMNPQSNWPDGHADKATALITELDNRKDIKLTKMDWSTGVIVAVKL
ncbi:class I SAM-dependent methyltransferase [Muricauda sp. 2012CJ35-5]|uniref:Class I SAM-dependent methyltransferase n=1 Tax=Flagellimonas spongiicola TaxID=2942208 RepID=A0ABT0PR84_9FLAO|nr:class I SAM-dependent methyltransferase [Allomuricauda spongiicola]MCL6273217.1 class I SAM-dependent methyltransferase [Allomuricauda spongiicola]